MSKFDRLFDMINPVYHEDCLVYGWTHHDWAAFWKYGSKYHDGRKLHYWNGRSYSLRTEEG